MNIAVTSAQMKAAEKHMIDELGLPSVVLMEKAAEKICQAAFSVYENTFKKKPSVCILCGCGNNGGDGLAVARIMHQKGFDVSVCIVGDETRSTDEFKLQKNIYKGINGSFTDIPIYDADLIIDAMLGIGIKGEVRGRYREVINRLNEIHSSSSNKVISVDIPSGLDADNGIALGCAVNADCTVCLGYCKTGLLLNDGPSYTGRLICDYIGIEPPKDYAAEEFTVKDISKIFPRRKSVSNKATYGKVTIIAGSEGMPGAALLAAKASFISGVGMVKLLTDNSMIPMVVSAMPEVMVDDYNNKTSVKSAIEWCDALLIGPGLGRSRASEELFTDVMEYCDKPMVIDADGLYHLSSHMELLTKRKKGSTILTPHPGEFVRLFETKKEDRAHQNISVLKDLATKYNITILAKDHNSLITDGNNVFINTFGTSALAEAGTGDVLAGIILTMLVNASSSVDSCIIGAAVHGLAGCIAAKKTNEYAVTAGDVISCIPEAVNSILA